MGYMISKHTSLFHFAFSLTIAELQGIIPKLMAL